MNKKSLYEFFDKQISETAISRRYNEWVIKGKWSIVSAWEDGWIDIWVCDVKNLPRGMLGERKLSNIQRGLLKTSAKLDFCRLTGEGYTQTRDKEVVLQNLKLLGIRKKRTLPPDFSISKQ